MRWLVDASNVIGARPDGWWRDRPGATRRLVAAVRAYAQRTGDELVVVLDAGPPEAAAADVVIAARRGRDAADDELVRRLAADPAPHAVTVVTSDRELAGRVRALGAEVEGARAFRHRIGM